MHVVVLSTHLDDAVLSVGARIAAATRRGDRVCVVTVLAGDPEASLPAGPWDLDSGFESAGEAARVRRDEDLRACAIVGAQPTWLSYADEQYPRGGSDDEIWEAIAPMFEEADEVLAPGFPLVHRDHRWLAGLVIAHRMEIGRLGLYVEHPYAVGRGRPHDRTRLVADRTCTAPMFEAERVSARDRRSRGRARRCYRTQLDQLGRAFEGTWRQLERRIARWERRHGTEPVAWLPPGR